jgi:Zn-dependent protease
VLGRDVDPFTRELEHHAAVNHESHPVNATARCLYRWPIAAVTLGETGTRGSRDAGGGGNVMVGLMLAWATSVVGGSAMVHEFGHAWVARAVGWKVIGLRWHWYGIAFIADPDGKPEKLWKVALGGLMATALLALLFLAGTALPEPAPLLFEFGFGLNAALLLTNLVPLRPLDGGHVVAGLRRDSSGSSLS